MSTTGAGSAPARRKTASTARKRATTAKPVGALSQSETQEEDAISEESVAAPVALDEVAVVIETVAVNNAVVETISLEYLPSHEEVATLAYTYWVDRSYSHGDPEQDWLRAEAALRQRGLATE
jgi:hypothetical protein